MHDMNQEQLEFVLYCVEALSEDLGRDTIDIYEMLKDSDVLYGYVVPLYEILHTQGKEYIIEDIRDVISEKGVAL